MAVIGVDIGKEVFHLVGFGADGKIAFRRKIRRLGLKDAFEKLPPVQIRAFLIEQGIAVGAGPRALRTSLFAILENRKDEISPRMAGLILDLHKDWCHLDERIDITGEIEELSRVEPKCQRLMSVPGMGQ